MAPLDRRLNILHTTHQEATYDHVALCKARLVTGWGVSCSEILLLITLAPLLRFALGYYIGLVTVRLDDVAL